MESINCIIKESEGECRAKRKDFLSSHALGDFRKCPELFRKKETGEIGDEDSPAYALYNMLNYLRFGNGWDVY